MCTLYFSDDKVELLDPPFNSEPGECVFVEGFEREIVGGKCNILSFTILDLAFLKASLASQPLHKREEERSGVTNLYLLQPGVQPNQIAPCHHQHYGVIPNAQADQSGTRSSCSKIYWDCPCYSL